MQQLHQGRNQHMAFASSAVYGASYDDPKQTVEGSHR